MPNRLTSRLSRGLTGMERNRKQGVMMAVDGASLLFAVWAAYSLRLGEWFMPSVEQLWLMVAAPVLSVPIFVRFGLYRAVVRYMGEHALWAVTKAENRGQLQTGFAYITNQHL